MLLQLLMTKAKFVKNYLLDNSIYIQIFFKKKTTETKRIPKDQAQGLILEGRKVIVLIHIIMCYIRC